MSCEEFQRTLVELGGSHDPEQAEHLRICSYCSELVADLNVIAQESLLLVEDEEPSPRVWNRLEIALRQEGLIHEPQPSPTPVRIPRWKSAWLVPVAACTLVIFSLLVYERGGIQPQMARQKSATSTTVARLNPETIPPDQAELLKIVESRSPALRAGYEAEFKAVNAYIRDAEWSVQHNPNDEISQQYLTNAYEQRAMVYEMAMDHGQP
ncbi:MAG TPA: anti-sigma factor [Terriglobales bacterium]|nr:anti-sigma factor [Terriglobales bacterium]